MSRGDDQPVKLLTKDEARRIAAPALRIATDCAAIRGGGHGEAGAAGGPVGADCNPGRSAAKTGA
jgi:hypothetical protein